MSKITFAVVLGIAVVGATVRADEKITYQSPGCWRTSGDSWSYEYCLMPEGVISSPEVRLDHYGKNGKKE